MVLLDLQVVRVLGECCSTLAAAMHGAVGGGKSHSYTAACMKARLGSLLSMQDHTGLRLTTCLR